MKSGLIAVVAVVALAGCKGEAKKDTGVGTAKGEVLPGSASDAMLPLDTVKSQAPLAPKSEGGEAGESKTAKPGKAAAKPEASAVAESKPEPSASPAEVPAPN